MVWKKTTQFEQPLLVEVGGGVDNYNCCNDHSLLMNLGNSGEAAVIPPY